MGLAATKRFEGRTKPFFSLYEDVRKPTFATVTAGSTKGERRDQDISTGWVQDRIRCRPLCDINIELRFQRRSAANVLRRCLSPLQLRHSQHPSRDRVHAQTPRQFECWVQNRHGKGLGPKGWQGCGELIASARR